MLNAKKLVATGLAAAVALSVSACGVTSGSSSSKFSGTAGDVANAIGDLQSDAQRHDAGKICDSLLASQILARLKRQHVNCADNLGRTIEEASSYNLDVKSVHVTGNSATATVADQAAGKAHTDTFKLVKQGGDWKILSIATAS